MKNKINKFECADKVRVISGVKDPDFGDNIEGWSGQIHEVVLLDNGSWMYHIALDKKTLSLLGDGYISKCENANFKFNFIYLDETELELLNINDNIKTGVLIA